MTVKELSQLYYLNASIEMMRERLAELREAADIRSPSISDMPRAPGLRDKVGDIVPRIADEEAELEEMLREMEEKRRELNAFITRVPNVRIRLILQLRYVKMMTWQEVADAIGGRETEYSVKKACYRYVGGMTASDQDGK